MRRTSCTMDGFCLFYLLVILLMRSGDVETNPGPDRIVSEEEFLKLSKLIEPGFFKEVGIHLKISIAELGQIKECSLNTSDALMTVFTRWRDIQPPGTDIRTLLADGLERSDLRSLAGEVLAGSLVPHKTGAPVTMPGSQTQPLSPDLIQRCADDFKFKYRTTLCKIRADPLNPDSIVPFDDMYANLVLEEEYRERKRRPLEYRDLFDLKVNGEFPKRIMIQGEAGAGKTTFCAKIAWDWINDSPVLQKFVWVLVVPFREAKQYTIGEIAKSYLSKDNPATACQITEYIRSNPKEVFIAFDGLDEFEGKVVQQRKAGSKSADQTQARPESKMNENKPSKLMLLKSSSPTSTGTLQPRVNSAEASGTSSERGGIALPDILRSDELEACPVLVTSRPWKVTEIRWDNRLRKLYTFMHVEGFSKENVEVYIHKYFEDDVATADQLIQLTKDNDIISENMAPYPIFIAMLCLMWRELGDEKLEKFKSFQTFSQIFDEMFEFLRVHYAQKMITDLDNPSFKAYIAQIEKLMEPVAKVAFIGLQENTLIFKEDRFEQCSDSMETACRVGVLSQEKRLSSIYDKSSPYLQSAIFFPHKLFQEYMAGVHLASLYESDCNEFNRLIEQVVLPRKEEFMYLLYFTVSQNKSIATHVMNSMLRRIDIERDFIVDVAFESLDPDVAALVKDRMSSEEGELFVNRSMTAHTVAGYAFIGPDLVELFIDRDCGPSMSLDVAEMICSIPSLEVVILQGAFHHCFFPTLATKGKESKVKTLELLDVKCPTPASSHHLVEALCSMPNLTDLTLGMKESSEDFFPSLKANASAIQVKTLELLDVKCPTPASWHHLVEALCSMPNLTDLTLGMKESNEDFFSSLKANASAIQVKTLLLYDVECPTPASSHHLVEALCSMPNLTHLAPGMKESNEDFFSSLKANASAIQVKTLLLYDVECPTPASWHHLAEALCSMPNLTDLTLGMKESNEDFFSSLKANASAIQVKTLKLLDVKCPTPASSHHLVEALCSMPNLTHLALGMKESNEDFYSSLKANASAIQVKTLKLDYVKWLTSASSHHLVEALCSMPNLTDLTLGIGFIDEFYSSLKANASSIQVKTLTLNAFGCPTPASSHHLVEALCSMPNLTDLTLERVLNQEFYSSLKANASSISNVKTLKLHGVGFLIPASSRHLVETLCLMPNLTDLTLGRNLNQEFYSSLKANASSIQVKTLTLHDVGCPTQASSRDLVETLCLMPNLTDLTLGIGFNDNDKFSSLLKAKASFIQGSFPQIRKGNFRFNGVPQDDLNSFLNTLSCMPSLYGSANSGDSNASDDSNDSDAPANSGNSNDSDDSSDSDAPADSGDSNASDNSSDSDAPANSGNSNDSDDSSDSDAPANSGNSNDSDDSSDSDAPADSGDSNASDNSSDSDAPANSGNSNDSDDSSDSDAPANSGNSNDSDDSSDSDAPANSGNSNDSDDSSDSDAPADSGDSNASDNSSDSDAPANSGNSNDSDDSSDSDAPANSGNSNDSDDSSDSDAPANSGNSNDSDDSSDSDAPADSGDSNASDNSSDSDAPANSGNSKDSDDSSDSDAPANSGSSNDSDDSSDSDAPADSGDSNASDNSSDSDAPANSGNSNDSDDSSDSDAPANSGNSNDSDDSSDSDAPANSGNSNDSDDSSDSDAPADSGDSNASDNSSDSDAPANSGNSNDSDDSSDSDAPADSGNSNDSDDSSDSDAPADSDNSNSSNNSADVGNSNNLDCSAIMANISVTTDVHSPRTLPSSDHTQQHVGNTSDAVCQTHRQGSSSQSRPYKRQAPSTQSRVPQDDHEIPEKQSKV